MLSLCIHHQYGGLTTSFVDTGPGGIYRRGRRPLSRQLWGSGNPPVQVLLRGDLRMLRLLRWSFELVLNPATIFREKSANRDRRERHKARELPVRLPPLQLSSVNHAPTKH